MINAMARYSLMSNKNSIISNKLTLLHSYSTNVISSYWTPIIYHVWNKCLFPCIEQTSNTANWRYWVPIIYFGLHHPAVCFELIKKSFRILSIYIIIDCLHTDLNAFAIGLALSWSARKWSTIKWLAVENISDFGKLVLHLRNVIGILKPWGEMVRYNYGWPKYNIKFH
jgi:hypothetical protein